MSEHELFADNGDKIVVRICDEPACIAIERFGPYPIDETEGNQIIDIPADVAAMVGRALIDLAGKIGYSNE